MTRSADRCTAEISRDAIVVHDPAYGSTFAVSLQRTIRVPEDGFTYPLPPGLGRLPLTRVVDHAGRVPPTWSERGGAMAPLHDREALWLSFSGPWWQPFAVKVGVGLVDAVSGAPWHNELRFDAAQDHVVTPPQAWLDGFRGGDGRVRQFVAVPLGSGRTVEGQRTGAEEHGGIQLVIVPPRPGAFTPPPPRDEMVAYSAPPAPAPATRAAPAALGIGAGGKIAQTVHPDPHDPSVWDEGRAIRVWLHLVAAADWRGLTGATPPPIPPDAQAWTAKGGRWFNLPDAGHGDLADDPFADIETVAGGGEPTTSIPGGQVVDLGGWPKP